MGYHRFCCLFLAFTLAACQLQPATDITTITLSGWQSSPAERQLLEQVLQGFHAKYPQIRVKYEAIADQYMDVIKTRLIGDAAPDVFYLDALEAPLLIRHGVLESLDHYITSELNLNDFQKNLLRAFQYQGQTYGIPKDFSTLALFYNPRLFRQAGLTQPPKTWQELQNYSARLTQDQNQDGRIDIYGLGITPELARQLFLIKAYGGRLTDRQGYATFASPQSLKGLQLIVNQYLQTQSAAQPSDVGASSGSEMFGQEKAAMVIEGTWAIPYFQETFPQLEFATAEVPTINRKKGTMIYTVAYVMNRKTRHKQAAWQLIAYLTGQEGMKAWGTLGLVLPSRKSVLAELGRDRHPLYAPFIQGANYGTLWQAGENLPLIMTHFNNQFLSTLIGEQPLKKAMQKAQADANREIKALDY